MCRFCANGLGDQDEFNMFGPRKTFTPMGRPTLGQINKPANPSPAPQEDKKENSTPTPQTNQTEEKQN